MDGSRPRLGRLRRRGQFATERDWEGSVLLTPTVVELTPQWISDGAGPPFAPSALDAPPGGLDAGDPAVVALTAQLRRQLPAPDRVDQELRQWRILARREDEVLFARGAPPQLTTVAMRHEGRAGWRSAAVTQAATLRVSRDGIRASGWDLHEDWLPAREDTIIRLLVTEQTRSGGTTAEKRLLPPDLYLDNEIVMLRMFVTPRAGIQMAARTPVTPVRVQLPTAIGERELVDGALYPPS